MLLPQQLRNTLQLFKLCHKSGDGKQDAGRVCRKRDRELERNFQQVITCFADIIRHRFFFTGEILKIETLLASRVFILNEGGLMSGSS